LEIQGDGGRTEGAVLAGNLYYCYKGKYYWFEMVILVRRLLLAVLISSYLPTPSSLAGTPRAALDPSR